MSTILTFHGFWLISSKAVKRPCKYWLVEVRERERERERENLQDSNFAYRF